jgi:mannose-6-phosphate isomerase-like protein (cupin superfamily)
MTTQGPRPFIGTHETVFQHGVTLRRLYPNRQVDPIWWGCAIASVAPNSEKTPHAHDEHESYLVLSGQGIACINGEETRMSAGDVLYISPFAKHSIRNEDPSVSLEYLATWWGGADAQERMRDHLTSHTGEDPNGT